MSENMKPSGKAWIGDIPESWDVKSLKYISDCNQNVISESTSPIYTFNYIDIGSVTFEKGIGELEELRFEDAPSRARRVVTNGDTIISTVRTYLKAIAYVNNSENMIASTGFAVYTPDKMLFPKYLYYFCISEGFVQEVDKFSYGIAYPAINTEVLSRIVVAYPKLAEQTLIANFLDEQCEKIDSVATDIEKQIEVLQKYKKSLITETVTKGLDKSVPMKESGIQWIGQIPEHWHVKRLKFMLSVSSGDAIANEELEEGEIPVYGGGKQMGFYNKHNVTTNTNLIGRVGANCGCVTLVKTNSWATDNALIVKTNYNSQYIYYLLLSADLNKLNDANAQPLITGAKVGNCTSAVALSYQEQTQIANYLDQQCSKIDSIIESKKEQLTKITQHKKSLIYEYVTGKKRVKGAESNGN